MRMRFWCMMFYFINFVDENDVLEKNSFASDVIWTANEFGSAFDVDEFEVNFVVVFQTHVHAFFNNNSNRNFVFPSCILFLEAVRMF